MENTNQAQPSRAPAVVDPAVRMKYRLEKLEENKDVIRVRFFNAFIQQIETGKRWGSTQIFLDLEGLVRNEVENGHGHDLHNFELELIKSYLDFQFKGAMNTNTSCPQILIEFGIQWKHFSDFVYTLAKIFSYLERVWLRNHVNDGKSPSNRILDQALSMFRDLIYTPVFQDQIQQNIAHCITDEDFFNGKLQETVSQLFQIHEILVYEFVYAAKANNQIKWTGDNYANYESKDTVMKHLFQDFLGILNDNLEKNQDIIIAASKRASSKPNKQGPTQGIKKVQKCAISKAFKKMNLSSEDVQMRQAKKSAIVKKSK